MMKNDHKFCPFCGKVWRYNAGIRNRLKKYGKTNVKCQSCGGWFEIKPEVKIDRRRKEYKDIYVCENNIQFGESNSV